jgi:hypothetical protein
MFKHRAIKMCKMHGGNAPHIHILYRCDAPAVLAPGKDCRTFWMTGWFESSNVQDVVVN